MKKIINLTLALVAGLAIAGCAKEYDDSTLSGKVDALEKKVTELDQKVTALTEQVTGLSATIEQWKTGGFVESVTDIKEGDVVIGYTVKFVGGQTVVLYNGEKGEKGEKGDTGEVGGAGAAGADGKTPEIISYEGDLVWAIDGTPVLVDGKPVSASVVPTFAVNEEGHLIMTLKGVETDLGLVKGADGQDGAGAGDSILKSIEKSADGKNLVFTLKGDPEVVYEIPFATAFKLVIENPEQEVTAGAIVKIPFTIQNGEGAVVDCFAGGNYTAKIDGSNVVVTVPDPLVAGQVLVWAQNDKGLFSMVKLSFITDAELVVVTAEDDYQAIPSAAGDFEIDLTSNVDLDAKVPAEATWITKAEVKASYKLTLTLTENETGEPREADVEIVRADNDNVVKTIKIVQLATAATTVKDVLDNAFTGISGTTYTDWADKDGTSGAVYAGQSAGDASTIQLRSDPTKAAAGIVTTTSAGVVKKVAVKWNDTKTAANRYLDVFVKNTPYAGPADQNDPDKLGYYVGSINRLAKGENEGEIDVPGSYAYLMLRSADGAIYLDEVTITWDTAETPADPEPVVSSYSWDFGSAEWQAKFAEVAAVGTDAYAWDINYDGLRLVSHNKSKSGDKFFQWGGKGTNRDRYISFDAPTNGYVVITSSNTGSSADDGRTILVENSANPEAQPGGFASGAPEDVVFQVNAGKVIISCPVNGLRFYKILFSETDPAAPKELTVERLWGKYPNTGWPTDYVPENADRGVATDGEFVFVANANTSTPEVVAIKISDQSKKNVNVTGVEGGYFPTCCARTIYNPATGKYILLVGTLANDTDCNFNVYAWEDGIDAAPTKLISWNTNNGSPRRIGDFFTVSGDWSNGEIWARINQDEAATTFVWKITDGVAGGVLGGPIGYAGSAGMGSVYKYSLDAPHVMVVTPTIAKFYTCTVESTWINANSDGIEWTDGSDVSAYAKRFGYTAFEFNGQKFIAYQHMYNAARSWLTILNDTQGTAEGFMQTIIDNDIFFQGAVQIESDTPSTDVVSGATYSGNTMANCSVAVMEDHVIIVGHQQNTGLAVFKMYMK